MGSDEHHAVDDDDLLPLDDDLAAHGSKEPRPVAHLLATAGKFPVSAHRAMEAVLRAMGFTVRYHERVRGGKMVLVEVDLYRPGRAAPCVPT